jgi:hypothetical protein
VRSPRATGFTTATRRRAFLFDDFDGDKLDESRWTADPAAEYTVANGEVVITDLTRTDGTGWSNADAFKMKGVPPMEEFMLEAQVSYEDDPNTGIFAVWLKANFQKAEPANAELDKKIKELINKLGDEDWEVREQATKDLGDVGEPAVPYLEQALQDPDPEVRMRAGSILGQTRTKLVPNSSQVGINDSWAQATGCKSAVSGSVPPYSTQPGTVASNTTHTLTIIKDASGRIDLQFDNSLLLSSTMRGAFSSLAISLGRFQNNSFGTVRIGRVILRKYMNPEPSLMVDVEQTSK